MKRKSFKTLALGLLAAVLIAGSVSADGDLITHWQFDEPTAGSTVIDSSGSGFDGTNTARGTAVLAGQPHWCAEITSARLKLGRLRIFPFPLLGRDAAVGNIPPTVFCGCSAPWSPSARGSRRVD